MLAGKLSTPYGHNICVLYDPMISWKRMVKMTTLTLRLPDDTHARLRQLAKQRKMSLNKFIEELSTIALTQFEAETCFRARATQGLVTTGLQ
jgi:predicted transcriptional regulator